MQSFGQNPQSAEGWIREAGRSEGEGAVGSNQEAIRGSRGDSGRLVHSLVQLGAGASTKGIGIAGVDCGNQMVTIGQRTGLQGCHAVHQGDRTTQLGCPIKEGDGSGWGATTNIYGCSKGNRTTIGGWIGGGSQNGGGCLGFQNLLGDNAFAGRGNPVIATVFGSNILGAWVGKGGGVGGHAIHQRNSAAQLSVAIKEGDGAGRSSPCRSAGHGSAESHLVILISARRCGSHGGGGVQHHVVAED